jgi:hypothetical protein
MGEIPVTYEEGAALLKNMEALERPLSLLTWSNIKTVAQQEPLSLWLN